MPSPPSDEREQGPQISEHVVEGGAEGDEDHHGDGGQGGGFKALQLVLIGGHGSAFAFGVGLRVATGALGPSLGHSTKPETIRQSLSRLAALTDQSTGGRVS